MLQYILECIAFQLVFLIIYDVFLKRETFFQWNRLYLIGTYIVSMVLPWIKIEAMKTTVPESFQAYPEFLWNMNNGMIVTNTEQETAFNISLEYSLLFGGMLLAALFFAYKLYQIYALKQKGEVHYFKEFTRIIVTNSSMAFSFFKSIFLGDKVIEREHENILQHELVHIRQRHSYDLMFFELMRVLGWFNPLVYVYQKRVSELHEFIADAHVAKTHKKEQYQLLLSEVFQTQHISFINQFFKSSLIKKRIVMLSKEKSKQVFKLKYLLLLPLVFGMLAYTSLEDQGIEGDEQAQTMNDSQLIETINSEIEKEIKEQGSLGQLHYNFTKTLNTNSNILSKEVYFKNQLLQARYFKSMELVIFGDDVEPTPVIELPLPSSARYRSYTLKIKAFQILDENLKYSIAAYDQDIILIEIGEKLPGQSFLFEVVDVKDLTGVELRAFNSKLSEIFEAESSEYENITLSDSEYTFKISTTDNNVELNMHVSNMSFPMDITESDTLQIKEVKNEEQAKVKATDPIPFAMVDEVPIFPGCENEDDNRACFQKSMQQHIGKNFRYPEEAIKQGAQGRVSVMFTIDDQGNIANVRMRGPDQLLEKEAARIIGLLPKMKPGIHKEKKVKVSYSIPITFKLNSNGPDYEILPKIGASDGDLNKSIHQYNQLVAERKRLLQSSNKANPIIFNLDQQLDQQLEAIKTKIQQSDTSQKELEVQFLKILKEREKLKINQSQLETVDVPFAVVEEVPVFPGCEDDDNKRSCFNKMIQRHIGKNFNYPLEAQEKGIQGRVSIMFTVSKDGSIQNVRMRGPYKILEKEAARIIGRLPKISPGKHKGKAVNVPFSIPITFKLQDDSYKFKDLKLSNMTDPNPLVIIDGKESTNAELRFISPSELESINILKGDAAHNLYGDKGKNGVVSVITKKSKIKGFDSEKTLSDMIGDNPLFIVDGEESTNEEMKKIKQNDVTTMKILKDEAATKKYGEKGKNGVIEITTKKKD